MRVCRKWNRVIESRSKQLTQRRILNLSYCGDRFDNFRMRHHFLESYSNYSNDCFLMEVTSESGKKLLIEEDSNRQTPEFRVFKNSIVDRLRESNFVTPVIFREVRGQNSSNHGPIELVEQRLKKIVELAGDRIPVRCFQFNGWSETEALSEFARFHDFFPKYVEAKELHIVIYHDDLFNRDSWKAGTTKPQKFIALIFLTWLPRNYNKDFDRIAVENGFQKVREDLDSKSQHSCNVYRLPHPKLKWAMEMKLDHDDVKLNIIEL
uniref:F-box domain-containing protein n=1 Tax=Acrobeloides nanus TaxID=290746 RepID=A0A914CSZ7_9BILA